MCVCVIFILMFLYAFSINVCMAMCIRVREHPCSGYTRATGVERVSAHARIVSLSIFLGLNHSLRGVRGKRKWRRYLAITPRDSVASTRASPNRLGSLPRGRWTRDFRKDRRIATAIVSQIFLRNRRTRRRTFSAP